MTRVSFVVLSGALIFGSQAGTSPKVGQAAEPQAIEALESLEGPGPVAIEEEPEFEEIERTMLRIAILNERPFFSYLDEFGYRTGFDVDIAYAICDSLEVECELEPMAYPQIVPALEEKRVDLAVASMPITDENEEVVDFTQKYYETQVRFVAPEDSRIEVSEAGLEERTLGVIRGSALDDYAKDHYWPATTLARYGTEDEMWIDLALGRLDAVLADVITARSSFLSNDLGGEFTFKGSSLDNPDYFGRGAGIAVREGDEELLTDLNQALETIRGGELYDEIRGRYFAYDIYGTDPSDNRAVTQSMRGF